MFDPDEAELEEDMMEDASETTSDGEDDEDDDDDTTISISDQDDEDVNLDRVREASPVFYIDPEEEEASSGNEETLTEQKVDEIATSVLEDVDEEVSLLRSVLCSPLGRMRTVSMMSASPPPPQSRPPGLKRPNSLVEQPRSLLRGRMRKTAIPLLGALVRQAGISTLVEQPWKSCVA